MSKSYDWVKEVTAGQLSEWETEAIAHELESLEAKVEALEKDNYSLRNKISLMGWERERARHQEITDGYRQAAQEQDDE